MAKIFPFRAFHYNTKTFPNLSEVITPPYDNIPAGDEKKYLGRSPYNFAHVDLPQSKDDDYSRSNLLLTKWREHGILTTDSTAGYYLYRQTFTIDGVRRTRDSLMCTVELCDFSEGIIRPHENTFGKYKSDRLQIMRTTKCNLSHIFGMVKDADGVLNSLYERWEFQEPLLHGSTDEGVDHAIWKLEPSRVPELTEFFAKQPIYIVDGHHRYESALAYARETGALGKPEVSASRMLFSIANSYDPALIVFPTHRRVIGGSKSLDRQALEKGYHLSSLNEKDLKTFTSKHHKTPEFALYLEGELKRCAPRGWEREEKELGHSLYKLSVNWSDRKFLPDVCGVNDDNRGDRVTYEKDYKKLWDARNPEDALIFHAPPAISDITDVADEKKFMPQKSTFFYPKVAAGLIMRDIS